MSRILLSLGGFKFVVSKVMYDQLAKRIAFRWTEIDIIGHKSLINYSGYGLEALDIKCEIYTSQSGRIGIEAYHDLKKMAVGKSHILVDSFGKNYGRWVICDLSQSESTITRDGLPLKIELNLQLKEFR